MRNAPTKNNKIIYKDVDRLIIHPLNIMYLLQIRNYTFFQEIRNYTCFVLYMQGWISSDTCRCHCTHQFYYKFHIMHDISTNALSLQSSLSVLKVARLIPWHLPFYNSQRIFLILFKKKKFLVGFETTSPCINQAILPPHQFTCTFFKTV